MNKRIPHETLKPRYVDNMILYAADMNEIISVLVAGVNQNKFDMDKLLMGSSKSVVVYKEEALESIPAKIGAYATLFRYGDEESVEDGDTLSLYRYDGDNWKYLRDLSFIDMAINTEDVSIALDNINDQLNKKLEIQDISDSVNNVLYEKETHKLTFERYDEVDIVIDLPIEALIENISLDTNNDLVLTFESGDEVTVPLNTLLVGVVKSVNGKTPDSSGVINLSYNDLKELPELYDNDEIDQMKSDTISYVDAADTLLSNKINNVEEVISGKQDKLVEGDNITINPITNVISVSGQVPLEENDVIINLQQNKADLVDGKVPLDQLPELEEQKGLVISDTEPTDSNIEMWVKLTGEEIIL